MNIIIRVDASIEIGSGHVMRCLTLADFLQEKGAEVAFICANLEGNMIDFIRENRYKVFPIGKGLGNVIDAKATIDILNEHQVDLLIVDHYQIDSNWEKTIKEKYYSIKLMVIDDLANREHECDLLLDQNYFKNLNNRYDHLIPAHCRKLLGPKYLLLRPEFYLGDKVKKAYKTIQDILVFYGGSDPTNETLKVLEAFDRLEVSNINVHVVVGLSNGKRDHIKEICAETQYSYYEQIDYIASLMRKSDLALGAGGVTMWERCFLGLPSIVTVVAENQIGSTHAAAEYGAIWNLGWHESVNMSNYVDIINRVLASPEMLTGMSNRARRLMHSEITYHTHPVVEAILEVLE
ncbi:UDP-2,4-diacetamido-2,4,6-trideoxy-beta-L-altropyranose hydrolase [Bacillus sp. S/N-304-OC-R1]|uniref:UDP-2,4-diacetamido-2,4, 6-trideoxy-beta-L-altropyranose hydrolase n=1 Tax=Bacillus sp. S/N-304-OC-R1 TaxID=2758034 RepID=UPI001C8CF605|nr:UDP-2,4-diacetamido-2,4,6-trideoxy-beta-L-altropyranose hydrolase [Bacillus sp. S/N-304-OC-R1]MBY0123451.1 UDP-2,4-diacetamido-2,4,6-trideoxy-beta-L-altropyranose hydrolase [Bacillus sp. S/N-304-OC-R1]